jgi:flagellum-specific ATP synthase
MYYGDKSRKVRQPGALAFAAARAALAALPHIRAEGRLAGVSCLSAEFGGLAPLLALGDRIHLVGRAGLRAAAEIVSFQAGSARAMSFAPLDGLGPEGLAELAARLDRQGRLVLERAGLAVGNGWLGRVIDPLGRPLDGLGPLSIGGTELPTRRAPPDAATRARLGERIELGVRALDLFATCRRGQRLGLFAGSGRQVHPSRHAGTTSSL